MPAKPLIPLPLGVSGKIVWAERHLDLIKERVEVYAKSQPYVVEAEFHEKPNPWPSLKHIPVQPGWVGVTRLRNPPPSELALMIGDFLQNLRNSLDHLARGLVVSNGGRPLDRGHSRTAFPLKTENKKAGIEIVAESGGAALDALIEVERLQPYHGRPYTAHPLFVLNELANRDKHRTLHVPVVGVGGPGFIFALVNYDIKKALVQPHIEWFDDGAVVSPMPMPWPADAKVNVEMKWSVVPIVVTLERVGPEIFPAVPMVDKLGALLGFVKTDVMPRFRPFFVGPWPPPLG